MDLLKIGFGDFEFGFSLIQCSERRNVVVIYFDLVFVITHELLDYLKVVVDRKESALQVVPRGVTDYRDLFLLCGRRKAHQKDNEKHPVEDYPGFVEPFMEHGRTPRTLVFESMSAFDRGKGLRGSGACGCLILLL